jgi:microcompartment protein CcmL/EutN
LISLRLGAGIGGKAVYHLVGPIADVEAAVAAGVAAVRIPELLVETVVLARPHAEYLEYMDGGPGRGSPTGGWARERGED